MREDKDIVLISWNFSPICLILTYHLALQISSSFQGLLIAVPPEAWPSWHKANPSRLVERLLCLARHINPRQVATSKRKPKPKTSKGHVDAKTAQYKRSCKGGPCRNLSPKRQYGVFPSSA